jgi:hypothetical protein
MSMTEHRSSHLVRAFFDRYRHCTLSHFVVDGGPEGPDLQLWAFSKLANDDIDALVEQDGADFESGIVEDGTFFHEAKEDGEEVVDVAALCPHWPDGLANGDRQLQSLIRRARAAASLGDGPRVFWQHISSGVLIEL